VRFEFNHVLTKFLPVTGEEMKRKNARITITLATLMAVVFFHWAFISRSVYDAKVISAAETKMWKAYYAGNRKALVYELLALERAQFGLTWAEAVTTTRHLGNAAMAFHDSQSGYEEKVLPDLIAAYTKIKDSKNLTFDPQAAARAELNWWMARRDPERSSTELVGAAIGELYGVLYGGMKDEFSSAGVLRAEAAALRDAGQGNADWQRIGYLLYESYSVLLSGL